MRVLHIPTGGLFSDGVYSCIYAYMSAMERQDIEIDVLATNKPPIDIISELKSINCKVIEIPYRRNDVKRYIKELYVYLKNNKYDIVHVHGSSSIMSIELFVAWLTGCKIRIAHSHNTKCENQKADKLLRPIFKCLYTHAFACGRDAGKWLFSEGKYEVIPNGRDLKKYEFSTNNRVYWRKQLDVNEDCLLIGHVGRFNEQKNHKYLIQIMEQVKNKNENAKLVLMGTGELMEEIKNNVYEKNLSNDVIFMGAIDNVNELLSAMDVMVLPSLYEGLPIVAIEWQASGLSCYLSDTITDECIVTKDVKKIAIDEHPIVWAEAIVNTKRKDREQTKENVKREMQLAGYDIMYDAKKLKSLYQKFIDGEQV